MGLFSFLKKKDRKEKASGATNPQVKPQSKSKARTAYDYASNSASAANVDVNGSNGANGTTQTPLNAPLNDSFVTASSITDNPFANGARGASVVPPPQAGADANADADAANADADGNPVTKRKNSFSTILRKPSFNFDSKVVPNTEKIQSGKITDLPEELLPAVTLINHQQSRCYFKGNSFYHDSTQQPPTTATTVATATATTSDAFHWSPAYLELNGNDITVEIVDMPPTIINICDCELNYSKSEVLLTVTVTNTSVIYFQFNTIDELDNFHAAILLCKFEYQQLQEAYTGALLSSQAIRFSDIKTLLSPNNKHIKEEWCVIRFPFLNDKWIRCLLVVKPNNKIEIYTHSSKSKKYLLSTINNGQSFYTIYPNDPSKIQSSSLLRLNGHCYINSDLLEVILNDDAFSSSNTENLSVRSKRSLRSKSKSKLKTRSSSLSKRLSMSSAISSSSTDSGSIFPPNTRQHQHQRVSSVDTTVSDSSFNNSKTPKKLSKKSIVKTQLVYIIPESHASVNPCEIMLRLLIPVLNSFSLYGRPQKFISSRSDKSSLLFGLPQLPNTYYLNTKAAQDLVSLNVDNSIRESWTPQGWNMLFKELMSTLMEKGWKGGSYQGDLAHLNLSLNRERDLSNAEYDPMEDFIERASNDHRMSTSVSVSRSQSVSASLANEV